MRTIAIEMTGDEIKALRRELDLTARKLGEAIGVDQATVMAWEREELFPTKRYVEAMQALRLKAREDGVIEAKEKRAGRPEGERSGMPWGALADPGVWRIFRKLAAYPELRGEVEALAEKYADPAED